MLSTVVSRLIAPGFFASPSVQAALVIGAVVAVACAAAGVFTVIRGQSFAGHALSDVSATGGSASFLIGFAPVWGFLGLTVAGAMIMEVIGIQRPRGRDLATGIVLGATLGVSALLLYWDTTFHNTTGATVTILFGSIFSIDRSVVVLVVVFTVVSVALIAALYRPLLLATLSPDIATVRGVPVRLVGLGYLVALAIAVALSALTVGSILSTALLIGPSATALRITRRPATAITCSALVGVAATWLGVLLAYDSFYWPPIGHGWPVSFFIVTLIFLFYLLAGVRGTRSRRALVGAPECSLTT